MEPLSANDLRVAGWLAAQTFDREKKDLTHYVLMARLVYEVATAAAQRTDDTRVGNDQAQYLMAAFNTAYNIAAACWPGWGTQGHRAITQELQQVGNAFAQRHLELAAALDLPAGRRANAFWIVGAHRLAARDFVGSRAALQNCQDIAIAGQVKETAIMARGWLVLIDALQGEAGARARLKEIEAELREMSDDGKFYAAQFDEALSVFASTSFTS